MKTPSFILLITLGYLLVGFLWIWFSDYLLEAWNATRFQSIKGSFYVIITAIALYLLLRRYQRKMKESETGILRMVNAFPQPIVVFDVESGKIYLTNKAWNNMLGLAITNISTVFSDKDLNVFHLTSQRTPGGLFTLGIHEYRTPNNTIMFMDTYAFETTYKNKRVYALLGIDASNHVQVLHTLLTKEEELAQSKRSLKDVAWMQSHQLRKPIANIIGLVQLAELHINDKEELTKLVQLLKDSAQEADDVLKVIVNKTFHLD